MKLLSHKTKKRAGVWVLILVLIAIVVIVLIGAKLVSIILSAVQRWEHRNQEPPPPAPIVCPTPEPNGWQPYRIQPEGSE